MITVKDGKQFAKIIQRTLAKCKTPEQREVISLLHSEILRDWDDGLLSFDASGEMVKAFDMEREEDENDK